MKNKKTLIIIIVGVIVLLAAVAIVFLTVFGGTFNKINDALKNSRKDFTSLTSSFTVTDGEQVVYGYAENVEITDDGAQIKKTTSKLNASFTLSTTEDFTVVENPDVNSFINFDFNKDYFTESKLKNGEFTATLKSDKIANFLNSDTAIKTDGKDASVNVIIKDGKIVFAIMVFTTETGKNVNFTLTCEYQGA